MASNAFMEELLFRGLFLGRYEPLIGKWLAILSTALAFNLAHMQVTYAPNLWIFLLVTLGVSIAWAAMTDRELVGIGLVSRRGGFVDHFAHLQQLRRRVMQKRRLPSEPKSALPLFALRNATAAPEGAHGQQLRS